LFIIFFDLLQFKVVCMFSLLENIKIRNLCTYLIYTHTMFTHSPMVDVMSMMSASIEYDMSIRRSTAKYNSIPVTTQIRRTDVRAPNTSALYHPNGIDWEAGFEATHRAHSEIIKLAKSVRRCEASVAIAKLLEK